jgi:hypothetical protein
MPLSGAESARNQILRQRILFPHLRKSKLFKFLTFRGKTVFSLKKRNRTGRSVDEKSRHLHSTWQRYSAKCQNNCISDTIHGLFTASL